MIGIVLGIDPGPNKSGFAALTIQPRPDLIESAQVIHGTDRGNSLGQRLFRLHNETISWIDRYKPQAIVMESWCKPYDNRWMASELAAEARAAVRIAAATRGRKILDYKPAVIKEHLISYHNASKEYVRQAVKIHLRIDHNLGEDEADAIAVALIHCWAHAA